jgi:hypothetical protein
MYTTIPRIMIYYAFLVLESVILSLNYVSSLFSNTSASSTELILKTREHLLRLLPLEYSHT